MVEHGFEEGHISDIQLSRNLSYIAVLFKEEPQQAQEDQRLQAIAPTPLGETKTKLKLFGPINHQLELEKVK